MFRQKRHAPVVDANAFPHTIAQHEAAVEHRHHRLCARREHAIDVDQYAFVARTGCGLLLDVNNVFISATNLGLSPTAYIDAYPLDAVGEVHVGGHDADTDDHGAPLLIDSHGAPVVDPVWALLDYALARSGPKPVLVEWDTDVPDWSILRAEATRAASALATLQTR